MLLAVLASTSAELAATSSRLRKVSLMAQVLRDLEPDEVPATVAFLSGELRQRRTGVGWASLRDLPPPSTAPSLEVAEVDRSFARIEAATGHGSSAVRREELAQLFARA